MRFTSMAHHLCCVLRGPLSMTGSHINLDSCLLQWCGFYPLIDRPIICVACLIWVWSIWHCRFSFPICTASLFRLNSAWCILKGQRKLAIYIFGILFLSLPHWLKRGSQVYYFILGNNVMLVDRVVLYPFLFFGFLLNHHMWDVLKRDVAYLLPIGLLSIFFFFFLLIWFPYIGPSCCYGSIHLWDTVNHQHGLWVKNRHHSPSSEHF